MHDIKIETGISIPDNINPKPLFHFDLAYKYKTYSGIRLQYNASNFYDLVNQRKKASNVNAVIIDHTKFWKFDIPHRIKQIHEASFFFGAETINDNFTKIETPDFLTIKNTLDSENLRKTIGSVDWEQGIKWTLTFSTIHIIEKNVLNLCRLYFEWQRYSTFWRPHNIFMAKLNGGWSYTKGGLAVGKFYLGGFGNRYLENLHVEQYRDIYRFPGVSIYTLPSEYFAKIHFENKLPPLRFKNAFWGPHYISNIDLSFFSQTLVNEFHVNQSWIDIGCQLNLKFKHWYNLESTLSIGIAKAWNRNQDSWEWFISFKPLKNQ